MANYGYADVPEMLAELVEAQQTALDAQQTALDAQQREIESLREALGALWASTVWGAGKGAVYEAHRRTMKTAGIDDIGD
jgi:hypothetical protein